METEIVIIGASLAGLMGGRALKAQGLSNFLICDAKSEVGLPLKCGEAVERQALCELFGDAIFSQPFIRNEISRHQVRFGQTQREFIFDYLELDRPGFENWLAQPLHEHLQLSTRISEITRTALGFRLQTKNDFIDCQAILLAIGANFSLHRALGLPCAKMELGYAFGGLYQNPTAAADHFLWQVEPQLEGYSWSFPKRDGTLNVGAAGIKPKVLKNTFGDFLKTLPIETNAQCTLGGHYPVSGPLKKTALPGVLVAGDAAGLVYAGTGEGIIYALTSGHLAGQTLARAALQNDYSLAVLKSYQRAWKNKFGKRLQSGVKFKRWLSLLLRSGQFERVLKKIPDAWLRPLLMGEPLPWRALVKVGVFWLFNVPKRSSV